MVVLLPVGAEEPLRAARVTLALIALNVLVFALVSPGDSRNLAEREAELERIAEWSLGEARRNHPPLDERAARFGTTLAFLHQDDLWRAEIDSTEDRERLAACLEDYRAIRSGHPFYRYGFVPSEIGLRSLLAHQFLHADVFHLAFNMLFLWAVGPLVELVLGSALFLAAYLASGVAAALSHAALNPANWEPAVGASGAVAGVMGILAVLHGRRRLRLVLVAMLAFAPRILFFSLPAYVFIALWLLEQIFFASFGSTVLGVAFGAHLGGFGFGALLALGYRAVHGTPRDFTLTAGA
jgi:membrane associated rhomboid family serine protease